MKVFLIFFSFVVIFFPHITNAKISAEQQKKIIATMNDFFKVPVTKQSVIILSKLAGATDSEIKSLKAELPSTPVDDKARHLSIRQRQFFLNDKPLEIFLHFDGTGAFLKMGQERWSYNSKLSFVENFNVLQRQYKFFWNKKYKSASMSWLLSSAWAQSNGWGDALQETFGILTGGMYYSWCQSAFSALTCAALYPLANKFVRSAGKMAISYYWPEEITCEGSVMTIKYPQDSQVVTLQLARDGQEKHIAIKPHSQVREFKDKMTELKMPKALTKKECDKIAEAILDTKIDGAQVNPDLPRQGTQ